MKTKTEAVLNLIEELQIEDEVFQALEAKLGQKHAAKPAVEDRPQAKKTSNGYEIYYDKTSGEAVGIVYKHVVFLKHLSSRRMTWHRAYVYCKKIEVNGIVAEPFWTSNEDWITEFKEKLHTELCQALQEIGAKKPEACSWAGAYDLDNAWRMDFQTGNIDYRAKYKQEAYIRPVLFLKHDYLL